MVAVLNFAAIVVFADLYITQPILPILSREFRVSPATAGLTISILVLMIALVSAPYGFLSDILGRKPVMVTSCLLLVIPTVLCAIAPSFRALMLLRALQGLLMPGVTAGPGALATTSARGTRAQSRTIRWESRAEGSWSPSPAFALECR